MKILNKKELHQIALDIDFQDFMNIYKKRTAKLGLFREIHRERNISPEERQKIIDDLRLI